jgi:hypothetical protein
MDKPLRLSLLVSVCLGLPGLASAVTGAPAPPNDAASPVLEGGRTGTLVLDNGNLLEGGVRRLGDRYQVTVPGGQIEVRTSEVRYLAADRDDAYRWVRGRIAQDEALPHLLLARWCIRWQLLGYAAREIIAAQDIDPKCPGIGPLQRQLHAATHVGQVTQTNHATGVRSRPTAKRRRHVRTRPRKRTGKTAGKLTPTTAQARRQTRAKPLTVRWPNATTRWPESPTKPHSLDPPAATPLVPSPPADRSTDPTDAASGKDESSGKGKLPQAFRPRDAFDPEIFNGRHASSQSR